MAYYRNPQARLIGQSIGCLISIAIIVVMFLCVGSIFIIQGINALN